jgi:hypothetical protein
MNLPETSMLNYFNAILISLWNLSSDGSSCPVESLLTQCKSVALGGQINIYDSALDYCKGCGLIQIKKKTVTISTLGQKFLDANRERYFEINEAQKQLIAERIIFRGAWNHYARELFALFSLNQISAIYELSIVDQTISKNQNSTIHFFKYLGILREKEFTIQVEKKYSGLVYQLTADSKAITEQQLEKILIENRKLGALAENAVVEFEKKRLRKLGKIAQAELVKRISTINASAGYDIESFDGTTDDIFPNRFVEVKATQGNEIRFYWSNNEIKVSRKLKNAYWIYIIINFKENEPQAAIPIMIKNPEHNIKKCDYLNMEAHTFLIKEIAEIELNKQSIDEIMWYHLG